MAKTEPEEDRLFDEAEDLLIYIQTDPDNPIPLEMAKRWLARGAAHERVWVAALQIHGWRQGACRLLPSGAQGRLYDFAPNTHGWRAFERSRPGGWYDLPGPRLVLRARADELTGTGEVRRIELADGSIITLGPDSAFKHVFTAAYRHIELLQGMAFFEIAPMTHDRFA